MRNNLLNCCFLHNSFSCGRIRKGERNEEEIDMEKKIPIGVSEFTEIILGNYYYIDKTQLIESILNSGSKVTLFTRPRRFGKTLNMTMLREFFDIQKDSRTLFEKLDISSSKCYLEINTYPVLYFSFRDCKGTKELLIQQMKLQLLEEYQRYYFLREQLDSFKKRSLDKIIKALESDDIEDFNKASSAIRFLTQIIHNYYNRPIILLIDEYDTPMLEAYTNGFYSELQGVFEILYGSALKDNPYLGKAVITGIQRVAKENIFSGLNNIRVCSVNSKTGNHYFGLTPEETEDMLKFYGMELGENIRSMYNGYNFAGQPIYNPWSILNYIETKQLQPFWVNTANNRIIRDLICGKRENDEFSKDFETLIELGKADVYVKNDTSFWELAENETLWGLLLNAGYITTEDGNWKTTQVVRIPNEEVKTEFKNIFAYYSKIPEGSLRKMFRYLVELGDIESFKAIYQNMVLQITSYMDAKEKAYHMLFLGMCSYLEPYYEIQSELEAGHGRSDIILKSKICS